MNKTKVLRFLSLFLSWQKKYISEKNFIIILSIFIGISAGLVAILLKNSVHFIQKVTFEEKNLDNYFYFLPFLGITLAFLLSKLLYKEKISHAISDILFAIFKKSAKISKNKMYSRFITSMVTVGLGGSAGLEASIVLTGSAIGSNVGKAFFLNYKNRVLLIGCGSAAVISAIFDAPIAGLIFSIEVILFDITITSFIPLLIASLTATLTSILLYGGSTTLFAFENINLFQIKHTPFYILLGIFCGLVAIGFDKSNIFIENIFKKLSNNYLKLFFGTSFLVLTITIFPALYGEGYQTINKILNHEINDIFNRSLFLPDKIGEGYFFLVFLSLMIIFKYWAYSFTINAGGSGGTFAPSLFLGCISGLLFSKTINLTYYSNELGVSLNNFALVGMCGVLSATQYAPLTAIFLIAELTGGYTLFVPLMIVSVIAYSTVSYFNSDSPYIRHLIQKGEYIKGNQDKKILSKLDAKKIIEKDFKTIQQNYFLKDLIPLIKKSKRHIFPVINQEKELLGIITLDDVREKMFEKNLQKTMEISSLMTPLPTSIELGEKMTSIIEKFEKTQAWNLPVISNKKYIGFISKSRIFNVYRDELVEQG